MTPYVVDGRADPLWSQLTIDMVLLLIGPSVAGPWPIAIAINRVPSPAHMVQIPAVGIVS